MLVSIDTDDSHFPLLILTPAARRTLPPMSAAVCETASCMSKHVFLPKEVATRTPLQSEEEGRQGGQPQDINYL